MGIRMNRHIVNGNTRYNMFCNDPTWDISDFGYRYLLAQGFHPVNNPWVQDSWEGYLLKYWYLKCTGLPTKELQYDQLNFESLYNHMQG